MQNMPITGTVSQAAPVDDRTLIDRVHAALGKVESLRISNAPVHVHISAGVVTLSGVVASHPVKAQAADTVRSVPGVRLVRDELWTDSELEIRVAHALASDKRTRQASLSISVNALNGFVTLIGHVRVTAIAQAVEAVAAGVGGVRAVFNRIQITTGR